MKEKQALIPLLLLFLTLSCTSKTVHNQSLTFYKPKNFLENLSYQMTKKSAKEWMAPILSPYANQIAGSKRLERLGDEFLLHLGGVHVTILTEEGQAIEGIYLNPDQYKNHHFQTLVKWKRILQNPKNGKMGECLEVNFEGSNLPSFLSMPPHLQALKKTKQSTKGVLCLPNFGCPYELDVKFLLNYLIRGFHVLAIHYPNQQEIEPARIAEEALVSAEWLKNQLLIDNASLLIAGKSFGCGPAIYAAAKCKGSSLILEKPFFRMSTSCDFSVNTLGKFFENRSKKIIETYYRFPNEDWISQVEGKILIIQSPREKTAALEEQYKRLSFLGEKITYLEVPNGYFGRLYDHGLPSWYTNEKSQELLDEFLEETLP